MTGSKDWIYQTNIYEVNIRQYTPEGSFRAFIPHLPRLKDMGIHTLWLMPVTPISQVEKKGSMGSYYACSDYTSINPEFGTLDDFKRLVMEAHRLQLKVIIDWVANHTGWDHRWTIEFPEWYKRDENGNFLKASGMDDIIELDFSQKEMRKAMTDAMKFWVKTCDIDGFRCDLASWVEVDFWREAIPRVNDLKPLLWLAEMDPLDYPEYMQVFDVAYSWAWMHKTAEWYQQKLPLKTLWHVLTDYENSPGMKAWFTSNHDENSWNGTEYEKYGDAAMALAVFSCTWPGIPLIYSGQELPNYKRLKFFDKDVIEWKGIPALHDFYKEILFLQTKNDALHAKSGVYRLATSAETSIMAYLRKGRTSEVIILLNLSSHSVRFDLLSNWVQGIFSELFTEKENDFSKNSHFQMQPWEYNVYVRL